MKAPHDVGGDVPSAPLERAEHDHAPWEKRVDALMMLLGERRGDGPLLRVDELRRGIEGLGERAYEELSYYERWIASIAGVLLEKGIITSAELGHKMEAIRARTEGEGA